MIRVRIRTPTRLHFGLLARGLQSRRQFGGVGLMIEAPRLELTAEPSPCWRTEGPLAERALHIAERVAAKLSSEGIGIGPAYLRIEMAPDEHVGLGVGTQLSLAVARALFAVSELPAPSIDKLSALTERGRRSGIGLHGFVHGGLIVDGGRGEQERMPPLLCRVAFPPDWGILIIQPRRFTGLYGKEEIQAFATLPPVAERVSDRLCRLVLLELLPALLEHDLESFGIALTEMQQRVGECFASAQGGTFARPELETIITVLRSEGLHGVGQSSWGPTLYAFGSQPPQEQHAILERIRVRFGLPADAVSWTKASPEGSQLMRIE